jgi:hypothetical protein
VISGLRLPINTALCFHKRIENDQNTNVKKQSVKCLLNVSRPFGDNSRQTIESRLQLETPRLLVQDRPEIATYHTKEIELI